MFTGLHILSNTFPIKYLHDVYTNTRWLVSNILTDVTALSSVSWFTDAADIEELIDTLRVI